MVFLVTAHQRFVIAATIANVNVPPDGMVVHLVGKIVDVGFESFISEADLISLFSPIELKYFTKLISTSRCFKLYIVLGMRSSKFPSPINV